ncbi:glycosyltransferase family 4 protein [Roseibaca sp. V10]|uniref:Glycosyltransferase family 4 protein n=1 Tax=Roseinatronobacter domitianus TaxID=2940293 RepID=A0ABT0M4D7_9RHOB|nr:glycosyltransferase family 4 protein [Roseibaca domitiana]MCL1629718.1 glycosyltransferase family 4 protein [Roseibaca domitiana]
MRIGYLMNTYPVTSATFIRREIGALDALGVGIARFAIRPWGEALVESADKDEAARTHYLLAPGALRLLGFFLTEALRNPTGVLRALGAMWTMARAAGHGALVRHVAYLLEAVHLKRASRGCDHIHAHFTTNTAAVALLCHRLGGPGFSFTAHGPDEFDDPKASSLALKLAGARFAVAITQFARTRLALAGGAGIWDKLHVVHCGVDLTDMTPAPPAPSDAPFVCVGRLCPQKAQVLLVQAMAELVQTHPKARLVLIGDGETRPQIEALIAQHGLQDSVELRGWADGAAVKAALASGRAMVLPSFAEGLPIVIMEAFALGRPVISTYIAGIPELVDREAGWLVPAGDISALAESLRKCLATPPERLALMGQTARARIEQRHDLDVSAKRLKALFEGATG